MSKTKKALKRRPLKHVKTKVIPWALKQRADGLPPDQFEIADELVPKGMVYQWCVWDVLGKEDIIFKAQWEKGGWKHVPAKRHPGAPLDDRGNIYLSGQMLMERSVAANDDALRREYDRAMSFIDREHGRDGYSPLSRTMSEPPMRAVGLKSTFVPDRPIEPTFIEVLLKVRLTANEVEVASFCGMTNEKYLQNKLELLRINRFDQSICAALFPIDDGFEFGGLSVKQTPVKSNDADN